MHEPFVVLFLLIPLSDPWVKGLDFGVFSVLGVRGTLGGISSIPLDLASFGGQNLGYGLPMRCSYYPQSLAQIRRAIRETRSWIWGSWPAGVVHPESPSHNSLTGASHRSDRCRPRLGFCSGEHLGVFAVVPYCCCFEFGSVWSSVGLFGVLGLSILNRSNWWATPAWPV
jgi:hypothetical protein